MPDLSLEEAGPRPVAGVDEAGRGPWAGPVVAAAVILDPARIPPGIDDSKKLSEARREALFDLIAAAAQMGIGQASVAEIDRHNILRATFMAMDRAVRALPEKPKRLLIDGNRAPNLGYPAETVVKGDSRSLSIAAASIIAKVTRDRLMAVLDSEFPEYGFSRHKGYGTPAHLAALQRLGVTPHHRRSYRPIHNILFVDSQITH